MNRLRLSQDLVLPIDAVTQKIAMVGRTGSGKTYGATKLAEEMLGAGAQIVALDPVGIWYGLRLAADGKAPGLSIPVLGGLHGEVPLEATGGALVADLVVDRGISVVLDVSQFESDADKARFGRAFAERFFFRRKALPSATHLFLEECQEFVPQNPQPGEQPMLHAFQRLNRLGRNYGIGTTLITQRPQDVNKKALNQAELVFAFQLTGPQERKAVDGWLSDKGLGLDLAADLPKLKVGYAHAWSPSWLEVSKVVRISLKRTFDASCTPEVGKRAEARELAPIDLEKLRAAMAKTIERARAEDPRELRRRVQELERQLAGRAAPAPAKIKTREVQVLDGKLVARLEKAVEDHARLQLKALDASAAVQAVVKELQRLLAAARRPAPAPIPFRGRAVEPAQPFRGDVPARRMPSNGLGSGEKKVLIAIAQHSGGVSREQLSVLAGYKKSTRDLYVQPLRSRGLVAPAGDRLVRTEAAIEVLGPSFEPLPTGDALRAHWLGRLPTGERKTLEVLLEAYPGVVAREAVSERTGYKKSTRDLYIQLLRSRQLVTVERDGGVRASETLFD
jgi:uncharacterized protein DUF87